METEQSADCRVREDTEAIKLFKNTKGFNWEIKVLGKCEDNLERLKLLNDWLQEHYGEGMGL